MLAAIGKAIGWIVLLLLVGLGLSAVWMGYSSGAWDKVPNDRDPRLVGRWTGTPRPAWKVRLAQETKQPLEPATYELKSDGTGLALSERGGRRSFIWGTDDGVLQIKYLATDYWPTPRYPYRFSQKGDKVSFEMERQSYWFASDWTRVP